MQVLELRNFDTYLFQSETSALEKYLKQDVTNDKIVVFFTHDEASARLSDALRIHITSNFGLLAKIFSIVHKIDVLDPYVIFLNLLSR